MPMLVTDADFVNYSDDHIAYEVEMFFWLAALLSNPSTRLLAPPADAKRLNNALIEAFALHLRNLLEFLYDSKHRDHIVAEQFYDAGVWRKACKREDKPEALRIAWGRADEEITHLTENRKPRNSPERVGWPFEEIVNGVRPLIEQFTATASPGKLSKKVRAAINSRPEEPSADKPVGIGPAASPGYQDRPIVTMTGTAAPIFEEEGGPKGRKG